MANNNNRLDNDIPGNGWTKYQQLVLNELQRHELKLNNMSEEITELRLSFARLEIELKNITQANIKMAEQLKLMDIARETHNVDIKFLTWKMSGFAAGVSVIVGAVIQGFVRYFLHS